MPELLLGIDGGGSKTRALIADRSGRVLGIGVAGSSNYQSVGLPAATGALEAAIAGALRGAAALDDQRFAAACLGLAGVDRPDDQALIERWIADRQLASRSAVVNDAELVLAAGTPEGWGVALICGTGSIAYGRAPDGRTARAGGWGYLLGDEGSGYDIAVRALRMVTQTADGRAHAAELHDAVLSAWQLSSAAQLIGYVYRPEVTRGEIAALARVVLELAERGDQSAMGIVDEAGGELGRTVAAVVGALGLQEPPLALGGGLIGAYRSLQQSVVDHVGMELGRLQYVDDPAQGALRIAQRLLDEHPPLL